MKNTPAVLSFDSFDGGGPEYEVEIGDPDLVSFTAKRSYASADHEEIDGAGYSVVYTFTGLKQGETQVRITGFSPITGCEIYVYSLDVDEMLNVTARFLFSEDPNAVAEPTPELVIEVNGKRFYADLEDNAAAEMFIEYLSPSDIAVEMHDYGGFEKVGDLPWTLPACDEQITTEPGDVILYEGDKITVYYDSNTWSLTRLARIGSDKKKELLDALGDGDVTVSFWLEWSE